MISTATPKVTPTTEIKVITETNVLLGRRYLNARSNSNGSPDMCAKLTGARAACQRGSRIQGLVRIPSHKCFAADPG